VDDSTGGTQNQPEAVSFVDISGNPFEQEIRDLAGRKLIEGVDATHFGPEECLLRGDWTVIAVRVLGVELPADCALISFTDVDQADVRCSAIAASATAGLMAGYGDGTFRPDQQLVRYEGLVSIAAGAGLTGPGGADAATVVAQHLPPSWQSIPEWAKYPSAAATRDGLNAFQKRPEEMDPAGCTRRDEAAGLLWKLRQRRDGGGGGGV
jgi:hypothetical protein